MNPPGVQLARPIRPGQAGRVRHDRLDESQGQLLGHAPTESFFNSLNNERVHGTRYATHDEARADLFDYIEIYYNRSRRQSTLGYQLPTQHLQHWIAIQTVRQLAA
jgi:putative transposase